MNDIKAYVDFCSTFGDPIIYNNIKIYPVLAKDYHRFLGVADILKIEKNKVPDVEVIQMSYLYYLIQLIRFDEMVRYAFMTLLQLSFHLDYDENKLIEGFEPDDILLQKLPNNEEVCFINGWDVEIKTRGKIASLVIGGHSISSGEFEDIRRIILFQNLHDFDEIEMNMSDDFRKVVEKYYELKNKGIHAPTVEDKALAIISHTAYTLETVKLLPMRSFDNLFHSIIAETDYIATKALEVHMPKGKSIDHWMYKPERQRYMEVFQDADAVAKKVTSM
jgi:hypothetical protein